MPVGLLAMSATLTIEPGTDDMREFVIDCPHATTRGTLVRAGDGIADAELLSILIDKHKQTCGCAEALRGRARPVTKRVLHLEVEDA